MLSYIYSFDTDVGKVRKNNEDVSYASVNKHGDIILLMLDGVGGHNKGELAARTTLNLIIKKFKDREKKFISTLGMKRWLKNSIKWANKEVNTMAQLIENKGMGTTIVGAIISSTKVVYSSVGDSRLYILSNGSLIQLTEDDSLCYKSYKKGEISKEEINTHPEKNVITKAIGHSSKIKLKVKVIRNDFSYILLCSDGLYNKVDEEKIKEILYKKIDIRIKVKELISTANKNGGEDNIGVLICEVIK